MASTIRGSDNFDSGYMLGVGQTWQDVKASRALGTTYTNNTGKPIMVCICLLSAGTAFYGINVNGVRAIALQNNVAAYRSNASVLVPAGATYDCTIIGGNTASIDTWSELR